MNERAGITEKIKSDPNAFLGWFTKTPGGSWQPFDMSTPIDADTELYARWRSDTYTVTYEIAAGDAQLGLAAPIDGNKYADGAVAVVKGIPVTATLDNQFANWVDENGNEVAAGSTLEMTRDITLTAVFKPVISYRFVDITYALAMAAEPRIQRPNSLTTALPISIATQMPALLLQMGMNSIAGTPSRRYWCRLSAGRACSRKDQCYTV